MSWIRCLSISTLLCAAALSFCTAMELESHCSQVEDYPLNFDLFMELLSNHSTIARGLKRAPLFGDMNPDSPAYEINGHGFHLPDSYMSMDIKRALCSNNEVTFYASMYLIEAHSSGTLLEISAGTGARLPVFGVYFSAGANEMMFTYRHLGVPHTVSVDQRLHTGRWRQYSFVLSGHLLQFYYDCELVFSDIVSLPDFCVDEDSFVVTFADDSDGSDVALGNGVHAFFQNVGFYLGRGGISKQCPGLGKECPSCGQYLRLVEMKHNLQEENESLRQENLKLKLEIERLENEVPVRAGSPTNCDMDDVVIDDGSFVVMDTGICFCQDGQLQCNPDMICTDNSTRPSPSTMPEPSCDPPCSDDDDKVCRDRVCVCDDGFALVGNNCQNQMCRNIGINGEDLAVGESSFMFVDGVGGSGPSCLISTCQFIPALNRLGALPTRRSCSGVMTQVDNAGGCSLVGLTEQQMNLSICCDICDRCDFNVCPEHSHCNPVNTIAECLCDTFYETNDEGDCVDIDECADGHEVRCGENAVCVNELENHTRGFTCVCESGYELDIVGLCKDINECTSTPSVCPTNSNCINTEGSYTCECISGYLRTSPTQCEPVCSEPCQNGGTCVDPETCACLPGYTGAICVDDVNECLTQNHMCTHRFSECVNTIGGHFCRCLRGYQGNGTNCEDIDECQSEIHECIRRGPNDCINTEGSYFCSCDMVDCTGYCRRRGVEYANGASFIDEINECNNCTCVSGEIFCHLRSCDGSCTDRVISKCCAKCRSRDCYLELADRNQGVVLRANSFWIDPNNPCIQWRCDSRLNLTSENMLARCPLLRCDPKFRVTHPGRCCPNCLLPPCDRDKEGVQLPLRNGCERCTCRNGDWNCTETVSCPETSCPDEAIVFYRDSCCPVCESDVVGSTCKTLAPSN